MFLALDGESNIISWELEGIFILFVYIQSIQYIRPAIVLSVYKFQSSLVSALGNPALGVLLQERSERFRVGKI